jgi:hypothetical protein
MAVVLGDPKERKRHTMAELISCAEREVRMRRQTYPRLIKLGTMSRAHADDEIGRMAQIESLLRRMAGREEA